VHDNDEVKTDAGLLRWEAFFDTAAAIGARTT
jgi:hypothetical protein